MSGHERDMLSPGEIREVIAHYAIARPVTAEPLGRGSRQSAKSRLRTPRGDFLLKRRAPRKSAPELVAFIHRFHAHLDARTVPVAHLMRTAEGATSVRAPHGVYELSQWVEGTRWSRSVADAAAVGVVVGEVLRAAEEFDEAPDAPTASFHASPSGANALALAAEHAARADPGADHAAVEAAVESLAQRLARATEQARTAGIERTPRRCIHGDMHPGNVLFAGGRVRALLDFDGARLDWRACEVANAAMHFSNEPIAGLPPESWRAELETGRLAAVMAGVERGLRVPLLPEERRAVPWLMIEACILESAVPIARTGRFAHLRADAFLPFIERKTAWIEANATAIGSVVG